MKHGIVCLCLVFMLCGCQWTRSSFEQGTVDMQTYIMNLQQALYEEESLFPLVNEHSLPFSTIIERYQLDTVDIKQAYVYESISELQGAKIAFFLMDEKSHAYVKKQWVKSLSRKQRNQCKDGRIGRYSYFVVGVDAQKVVNYIKG